MWFYKFENMNFKMEVAQSELDVFLTNQNYEKDKLEETRKKLEEYANIAIEREKLVKWIFWVSIKGWKYDFNLWL